MHDASHSQHECITQCWTCRHECQKIFFGHCLELGGKHVEQNHARLIVDCMEMCESAADSMVRQSPVYAAICAAAAHVATACAESCDTIDTQEMRHLAAVCRACAQSCHDMSLGGKDPLAPAFPQIAGENARPAG